MIQAAACPQREKAATKNRHRDTPVTMSAFIMGMLLMVIRGALQRRRML